MSCSWFRSSSGVASASTGASPQPEPSFSNPTSQFHQILTSYPPSSQTKLVSDPSLSNGNPFSTEADERDDFCFLNGVYSDEELEHELRVAGPCLHSLPFFVVCILRQVAREDPVLSSWLSLVGVEPNPGPPKGSGAKAQPRKMTPAKSKQKKRQPSNRIPTTGRAIGASIGGWVGEMAGKAIRSITGFGDYTVSHNSLLHANQIPQFSPNSRTVLVRRREFVATVSSPGPGFTTTTFDINPMSAFFPWLSEIAGSFEQFIVHGMVVEFKSSSANAVSSTNTALGVVMLATQYNVLSPPFTSRSQMESYDFVTSCSPCEDMIHPIECAPNMTPVRELYVDRGYGGDPRLSILGLTTIATVGQQAGSVVGELWVSYDIELVRPKLLSGLPTTGLGYSATWTGGNSPNAISTPSTYFANLAALFPAGSLPSGSDLDVVYDMSRTNTITFPIGTAGTYLITFSVAGTAGPFNIVGAFYAGGGVSLATTFPTFSGSSVTPNTSIFQTVPLNTGTVTSGAFTVTVCAVFAGSPYPLGPSSVGGPRLAGVRPYVTFPTFVGNDGASFNRLTVTPVPVVSL